MSYQNTCILNSSRLVEGSTLVRNTEEEQFFFILALVNTGTTQEQHLVLQDYILMAVHMTKNWRKQIKEQY